MRSTISMSSNTALNNILDNYSSLLSIQNQMSTGSRVTKPSEDPLAANVGMRLDSVISRITQYNANIKVGTSFLSLSDNALSDVNKLLTKAKSLTVGAASETTTAEMRRTNATEMNNMLQELVVLGNRTDGLRYVFGGTETQQPPFSIVGGRYVYYSGNDEKVRMQTDTSTYMPVNVTGNDVFGAMLSRVSSSDLSPDVNLDAGRSTRLEDLNLGAGVPKGSVNIKYSDYPVNGLNIDLSTADTLEDVKRIVEKTTLDAGQKAYAGNTRYIRVDINENHDGITLTESDWITGVGANPSFPLEVREVSNNTVARDLGILGAGTLTVPVVNDNQGAGATAQLSQITLNNVRAGINSGPAGQLYAEITAGGVVNLYSDAGHITRVATGTVNLGTGIVVLSQDNASGINGTVRLALPPNADNDIVVGTPQSAIEGKDVNPRVSEQTVLADLKNYTDGPISIANGGKPGYVALTSLNDPNKQIQAWNLSGLTQDQHTDEDDKLYATIEDFGGTRSISFYSGSERIPTQLVATGSTTTGGTVTLQEENNSGLRGTVSLLAPGANATYNIDAQASYDATFRSTVSVPAYNETVPAGNTKVLDQYRIRGLSKGMDYDKDGNLDTGNTDAAGNLYMETTRAADGTFVVNAYRDAAKTTLVATGTLNVPVPVAAGTLVDGDVELTGTAGFEEVTGSVHLSWDADALAVGSTQDATLTSTFATVGDLMTAINASNTYTTAALTENGKGFEIVSHLAGAYLSVGSTSYNVGISDDDTAASPQLASLNLYGIMQGVNTDTYGNLFTSITATGPGPGDGTIQIYKDEARTQLVASGIINGRGSVSLQAENNSGLTGDVFFTSAAVTDDADVRMNLHQYRSTGDDANTPGGTPQLDRLSLTGVVAGKNSDANGKLYATVVAPDIVELYADEARTQLVARGQADPAAVPQTGYVQLSAMNNSGVKGSVYLPVVAGAVAGVNDADIELNPQLGLGLNGQVREDNLFSTYNDIIDAMHSNDTDSLHNLLGNFETETTRVVLARADIGSRVQRLEMLTNRHEDEITDFSAIRADRISLDYADAIVKFQSLQNVFDASLRVTGQIIPMSLVDFI